MALTLWRAATKNEAQISNAFIKKQYAINLVNLSEWPAEHPFAPSCRTCLSKSVAGLQKGLTITAQMFTIFVHKYVETRKPDFPTPQMAGYLSAAVLTHTARNGLGIIQLLEQVTIETKRNWQNIFKLTYFNITKPYWETIVKFFTTYLQEANPQHGYNWARIINDGYLRDLSPKEMLPSAGIFAGVIEAR